MATDMDIDDDITPRNNGYTTEDDEIVAELDVYSCSNVLPQTAHPYLLQFPQRGQDRPYESVKDVRLKSKVKRMQWDVALNPDAPTYNSNVDPALRLKAFTLQSDRVDPGVQGLAVAMRRGSRLYLVPIQEILQLRHSPAYLDSKDKEAQRRGGVTAASTSNGAGDASGSGDGKSIDMLPITVQVKKHETEQQTEARLRSYAYHSLQEETDVWIDLRHHAASSSHAKAMLESLPKGADNAGPPPVTHARSTYLDAITPGPSARADLDNPDDVNVVDGGGVGGGGGGNGFNGELGRPAGTLAGAGGGGQLTPDALAALPTALRALFDASPVLSLENLRAMLAKFPTSGVLNRAAETASDPALHAAIMGAGDYLCIRKTYTLRTLGNPAVDPVRSIVLELLQEKEQLKRGDVFEAASERGISLTDTMYQKVMKELCSSRGSVWSFKAGGQPG